MLGFIRIFFGGVRGFFWVNNPSGFADGVRRPRSSTFNFKIPRAKLPDSPCPHWPRPAIKDVCMWKIIWMATGRAYRLASADIGRRDCWTVVTPVGDQGRGGGTLRDWRLQCRLMLRLGAPRLDLLSPPKSAPDRCDCCGTRRLYFLQSFR